MRTIEKIAALLISHTLAAALPTNLSNGSQSFEWKHCPQWLVPGNSTLRCGSLSVPLDWDSPAKGAITIGVMKLPARDPKNRIGNVFFQPGGPGNQGSSSVLQMTTGDLEVGADILDRFDMIGVDPRGTGLSEPLKCDVQLYNARLPYYPSDPDSFQKRVEYNLAMRKSCLEMSGNNLIDYMDSISIAKDYEAVRVALGNEPMNWLSVSYGTQLGSQYAELFPDNIRSMVFDGVVSQSQAQISQFLAGAAGLDATFRGFAQWCQKQNATTCPAIQDSKNRSVEEIWMDIMAQTEAKPMPCTASWCPGPTVTADELRYVTSRYLYLQSKNWPRLGAAIYNTTLQNDASSIAQLYDPLTGNGSAKSIYDNSATFANLAISCQDWAHHDTTAEDLKLKQELARSEAFLLNGLSSPYGFQLQCIGWPNNLRNPPHAISIPRTSKLPKILITETIYDPATPMAWGMQLREEIGKDRVVIVLKNGGGHPSYEQKDAAGGETKTAIERYILDLTLPEDGVIFNS
ncbi:alpha/beta-hydrolase [Hypomontagnella submonticulosa]|nr:alpha/beta-hydrolase [Hypomontagnella submonticulosa]